MFRTTVALFVLLILSGCQSSEPPQTTAEKCSNIDMQISTTQENDTIEDDAKAEMIDGFVQEKADLNCP
jgi:predicted component of type VI protein secretion system